MTPLVVGVRTASAETVAEAKLAEIAATGGNGEIVYAVTPSAQVLPIGVPPVPQLIVRSEFAVLDGEVLQSHGKTAVSEGKEYHYVAPLEASTTIDGVFVRQGGGGMTIGSTTVTKSETLTFVFDKTGRYSVARDKDVAISMANAGGGSSSDDSSTGSYQLAGYAIELRPDHGEPMRLPFFAYTIDPFWPDSNSSDDLVNALNLGTELFYRDNGEK
jgi:hypothetical protein